MAEVREIKSPLDRIRPRLHASIKSAIEAYPGIHTHEMHWYATNSGRLRDAVSHRGKRGGTRITLDVGRGEKHSIHTEPHWKEKDDVYPSRSDLITWAGLVQLGIRGLHTAHVDKTGKVVGFSSFEPTIKMIKDAKDSGMQGMQDYILFGIKFGGMESGRDFAKDLEANGYLKTEFSPSEGYQFNPETGCFEKTKRKT